MLKPLKDKVLVLLDEVIASAAGSGIYIPPKTDAWRGKNGAIEGENRGVVLAVGPGLRTDAGYFMPMSVKPGDVVRFSELEYPSETVDGRRHVLIGESDILWVEEAEEA